MFRLGGDETSLQVEMMRPENRNEVSKGLFIVCNTSKTSKQFQTSIAFVHELCLSVKDYGALLTTLVC